MYSEVLYISTVITAIVSIYTCPSYRKIPSTLYPLISTLSKRCVNYTSVISVILCYIFLYVIMLLFELINGIINKFCS